ncbi:MAG: glyoxalase/bleomycin resistance protein [Alphaproteobacteria bacterium]|nr:MAG: glyoxalase/bleomycin resistance protein [Caulobacteraceae bacterium]TPW03398.1 MAG: glyoxalase/bleomycin resistance protein [Alphaproteobacteria bacterium]
MTDRITANLPARDLAETAAFYGKLGFSVTFRDAGWMILTRGPLELEFFPYPELNPAESSFSACVRVADVDRLHADWSTAALPQNGIPRLTPPRDEAFGFRMSALVDPNGSLLRCLTALG